MSGSFAHTGHWLASLAYLAPLLFLAGVIGWGKPNERRNRRAGSAR